MLTRRIVLLEFNELSPPLLARWISQGQLPHFKRFFEGSHVFTTMADDPVNLEPWIQWYSLHTGLDYAQHKVALLTDGPLRGHQDIWQILLKNGYKVANCGSMNAKAFRAPGSFYLPDPWCTTEAPFPEELSVYQRVVTTHVQENTTGAGAGLTKHDYLRFLSFMARHGLRAKTLRAFVTQMWSDTLRQKDTHWKRVPLLDKLQFDLFRHYWEKSCPDFATFFINSTAHYQHAYWHCLFPEEFSDPIDRAEHEKFGGAILHGYRQMDHLLKDFFGFEKEGVTLILATALSQRANPRAGLFYYRPVDVSRLLALLGLQAESVLPVMAEQFSVRFADAMRAAAAKERLATLSFDGNAVFRFGDAADNSVFFGALFRTEVPGDAVIEGFPDGRGRKFHEVLYQIRHTKRGVHHPDGVLWIKTGEHRVHDGNVSILDVLPTLVEHYGIDRTSIDYHRQMRGTSLLSQLNGTSTEEPLPIKLIRF